MTTEKQAQRVEETLAKKVARRRRKGDTRQEVMDRFDLISKKEVSRLTGIGEVLLQDFQVKKIQKHLGTDQYNTTIKEVTRETAHKTLFKTTVTADYGDSNIDKTVYIESVVDAAQALHNVINILETNLTADRVLIETQLLAEDELTEVHEIKVFEP